MYCITLLQIVEKDTEINQLYYTDIVLLTDKNDLMYNQT